MDYWEYKRLLKHVSTNILSWELRKKTCSLESIFFFFPLSRSSSELECAAEGRADIFSPLSLLKPAVFLEIAFESRDKGGGMPSLSNVSWNSEFANYKNFYSINTTLSSKLRTGTWRGILPGQQNEGFALSLSFTNAVVHTACILSLIELFGYFMLLKAVAPAFHIRLEPSANYVCLFNIIHNFHASRNFACSSSRLHYQVWPLRLPRPKTVNEFIEGQEHSSEARSC